MMKKLIFVLSTILLAGVYSCNNDAKLSGVITVNSEFQSLSEAEQPDDNGWTGHFAEYSNKTSDSILNMQSGVSRLPAPLDTTRYSFRLQSNNRSDDMFMFIKKQVTGLQPDRAYRITFDISMATQYPDSSFGAGGSPASSVFIKAGASPNEPLVKLVDGFYTVNIDKGNQSKGGTEMVVLGNAGNETSDAIYRLVSRSNSNNPVVVRTSASGHLWLCVGSDSGYEGLTNLFYDRITASLTLVEE